ncbi:type 4a pilus biogenesis protein PilO [Candidatus Omnitrophota bacterium]
MLITKLSGKEKLILACAVIFVLSALIDRLVITPIGDKIGSINQQIKLDESQLKRHLRNFNQRADVKKEYDKYAPYVKKVGSDEEETAKILGEIEELARKADVRLVDMKPRPPEEVDFYKEYTVELEAEGEMNTVVTFLFKLNSSTQLLRAEKLRINPKEKGSSTVKASILVTKILIP